MARPTKRHPRDEARAVLLAQAPDIAAEPGIVVHVLEPSPPAVRTEPFADDPGPAGAGPAVSLPQAAVASAQSASGTRTRRRAAVMDVLFFMVIPFVVACYVRYCVMSSC